MMDGENLIGGRSTAGVVRIGNTVRRPIRGDASFRHELLLHLERVGFNPTPCFLGIDNLGREILSFAAGTVPADLGFYTDAQISEAAGLLRRFHDATVDIPLVRAAGFEVACHNDWAPTNAVFVADRPVAMIDFDTAQPGERLWDAGYSAFTWLDLGNDDYSADAQVRRLSVFADSYGREKCSVARLAVHVVARQTALAASTRAYGKLEIAEWAAACAIWTTLNIVERLAPTEYPTSTKR